MTMPPDNPREPWLTSGPAHQNSTPRAGEWCDLLVSGFAGRLSSQYPAAEPGSLGIDLPLLAPQRAAADIYRHLYQTPDSEPGKYPVGKAKADSDQPVKPAGAAVQADSSRDKKVQLKKKKMNANRFRARPNKPTDWQ
jgi:hypothetical protein